MDQEAGDLIAVDYGLYQSLSGPSRRRVLRDADMDQPPPTEGKYDEDVEHGEPGRHDREVVAGPSLLSLRRSMSMGGRPRRRRDRHRQSRRQPARCHRMRVSGLTTRTVARRSRKFPTRVASNQRSKGRRRGRLTCLRGTTTCWRRSRFSAASAARGPGPRARGLAETAGGWSRQLRPCHGSGLGGGVRRPSPFPAGRLYCGGQECQVLGDEARPRAESRDERADDGLDQRQHHARIATTGPLVAGESESRIGYAGLPACIPSIRKTPHETNIWPPQGRETRKPRRIAQLLPPGGVNCASLEFSHTTTWTMRLDD